MEKNAFEEAYDYYYNEEDYDLKEAITKFKDAAGAGYSNAYFELYNLYSLEYNDRKYKIIAFDYLEKAVNAGCKKAYMEYAYICSNKNDNFFDLKKAIKTYMKASAFNEKAISKCDKCLSFIDEDIKKKGDKAAFEYIDFLQSIYYDAPTYLASKIEAEGKKLFKEICEKMSRMIDSVERLEKYYDFLKKYKAFSSDSDLYDYYFNKKGAFSIKSDYSIDNMEKTLDIYSNIKNVEMRNNCQSKIYVKMAIYYLNKYNFDYNEKILSYLNKIINDDFTDELVVYLDSYLSFIMGKNIDSSYLEEYVLILEKNGIKDLTRKIREKINFERNAKEMISGNKNAIISVIKAYKNGRGVSKDIRVAEDLTLKAFCNNPDKDYLDILYSFYSNVKELDNAISEFAKNNNLSNIASINNYLGKNDFDEFEKYLKKSNNAIRLFGHESDNVLESFYHESRNKKCYVSCNTNKEYCNWWYKYWSKCSNIFYEKKYYVPYSTINDLFFNKIETLKKGNIFNKKVVNIVLVGCGNFYELSSLNDIAKEYSKTRFNIIVLDRFIWQKNRLNDIDGNNCFCNLWFKKCDFYDELKNDIYNKADLIYFSRCIIPYDYRYDFNSAKSSLNRIIKKGPITVFSEVLDIDTNRDVGDKEIIFELNFRDYLYSIYDVESFFVRYKYLYDYGIQQEKMYEQVKYKDKNALQYYLFALEGVK